MPVAGLAYPCAAPSCPALASIGRYCVAHSGLGREHDRLRGSAATRGYDAAWRRFRDAFLRSNPLCADCGARGRVRASREVHHVLKLAARPELRLAPANCMALCKPCHSARTARGE